MNVTLMTTKKPRLKPAVKAAWIAALRSGDYKQGVGRLRSADNSFCCLGVLCNLHAIAHPRDAAKEKDPSRYLGQKNFLPAKVLQWAFESGAEQFGKIGRMERIYSLAHVNDQAGAGFSEIADYIERGL